MTCYKCLTYHPNTIAITLNHQPKNICKFCRDAEKAERDKLRTEFWKVNKKEGNK